MENRDHYVEVEGRISAAVGSVLPSKHASEARASAIGQRFRKPRRVLVLHAEKDEADFQSLVHHLRRGTLELRSEWGKKLQGEECLSFILECHMKRRNLLLNADAVDCFTVSSWCRFPWYEADFGWGKPVWAAVGEYRFPNVIMLMDNRDAKGVEAWVILPEEDMALFQNNPELLAYSYLKPSASI